MRNPRLTQIVFLFMILFSFIFITTFTGMQIVKIYPPFQTTALKPISINVSIENVNDLYGYEADITFNDSVLSFVSIEEGPFLSEGFKKQTVFINGSLEKNTISAVLSSRLGEVGGVSGSGVLFTIKFMPISSGYATINITHLLLSNSNAENISYEGVEGGVIYACIPSQEVCNSIDDDCNGIVDDVNGGSSVEETRCRCYNGAPPLEKEVCPDNGIDDDCNGIVDDSDCCTPGETRPCPLQKGVCSGSMQACGEDGQWIECNYGMYYEPNESTCDALDNDCDGAVDEGFDKDRDGFLPPECTGYKVYDCNDNDASINPNAKEICDGIDNDCDAEIDENCGQPIVINMSYYDSVINVTGISLNNVKVVLEKKKYGKVVFKENVSLNVSLDFNPPNTIIEFNKVYINTELLPMLNKPARIYLYNLTFTNPIIMKDDSKCPESICKKISYENGTLVFDVEHFTTYWATDVCNDGTPYGQCSQTKPKYCQNGQLVDNCQLCGCPSGRVCINNVCIVPSGGGGVLAMPQPAIKQKICEDGDEIICGSDIGECRPGVQICINNSWSECRGGVLPSKEICDGKDNDCDGKIDEGLSCECKKGEIRECGSDIGICKKGIMECEDGKWGPCIGSIEPREEVCNNALDDDCDGMVDEGCISDTCNNGVKDEGEEGVDCGGICPNPCGVSIHSYLFILVIIAEVAIVLVCIVLIKRARKGYQQSF